MDITSFVGFVPLGDAGIVQSDQMPILFPLVVGIATILATILIQALPLGATVWIVRRLKSLDRTARSFWTDTGIITLIILLALAAHLIEIALWAFVFLRCGEFAEFGMAYYRSAVNFTTLGYGDVLLSPHWRMLGPLEAADGMLMFGVSTAMIFSVILRLAQTKFVDLKD